MTTQSMNLQTRLRLVRPPESVLTPEPRGARVPSRAQTDEVARTNRASATIGVDELREAFSSRVAESLEGGASAILRPERRARLVDLATRMGIRAFDAHLLIALTQDAARRGEITLGNGDPTTGDRDGSQLGARADVRVTLAVGAVLGIALAMCAIFWILRG